MLSTIIYETVDFVYTIGKMTVRGIRSAYSWIRKEENITQLRIKSLESRISELENIHQNKQLRAF
jgi:hypothetical protein